MEKLKIAIPGTRGIPNQYGGFEQLAEYLSVGLAEKGHSVTVYNSHRHAFTGKKWKNVTIVHCHDPENWMGAAGQFIYDLNCIKHSSRQQYDIVLFPGYTSSSVWGRLYPKKSVIISHMDGLEWKRSKYSRPVQQFLKYAEKLAVKYSQFYITDSESIQSYLKNKYDISSQYIPYGAEIFMNENTAYLEEFKLIPGNYYMLMARMEPENNIEMILEAFHQSSSTKKFLVLGSTDNKLGRKIARKFSGDPRILFAGAVYDAVKTHSLKYYSSVYFHGHSVGGTNHSLLEAMASRALVAAHNNPFNLEVLQQNGLYFASVNDIKNIINQPPGKELKEKMISNNLDAIRKRFSWDKVIDQYESFMLSCYHGQ